MNKEFALGRAAHGAASLTILAALLLAVGAIAAAIHAEFGSGLDALKARRESAAALEARIAEFRTATTERLRQIGAEPGDASLITDPDRLRARMTDLCAALAQSMSARCAVEVAPLTASLSAWRATVGATGALPPLATALAEAARPPVRIAALKIRAASGGAVELSATLEIVAARPESEAE